ncbi:MAG: hypothetical protein V1800_16600 [Candidatus Latescibacterota bacterium]
MRKFVVVFVTAFFFVTLTSLAQAAWYDQLQGDTPTVRRTGGSTTLARAPYGQPYFFGHFGIYQPNNSGDGLDGFDSGMNVEAGIGSNVSTNLAIDGTLGVYSATGRGSATVIPVTVGARLILPTGSIEPYVGAGVGLCYANVYQASRNINGNQLAIGGYGSVGVDAWMTPRMALNLEGKYHWAEPSINGYSVAVSGWLLNLGVRLAF